ncbi:MAG: DUF615 domain-containing protein [Steroidobacteraceae bacterium]|nr:DUF615 domain-containing protein [Steroidobacteraceae bacterium]
MRRRQLPGEPAPPTKTALKRQAQVLQDLADRLIEAPEELVAGLELPEKLADALALARRITSHGAKLRQRLFVGKLLRGVDPVPIRAALDESAATARIAAARFRRAERWRDRLVREGTGAIAEFVAEFPQASPAELRRLAAQAAAEHASGKSAGAGKALFHWIRDQLSHTALQ